MIALAVIVALRTKRVVFGDDTAAASDVVPNGARVLAVLSLILWAGAITVGKLMEYIKW